MKINNMCCTRRLVQIYAAVSASMSFMLAGLAGCWTSSSVPYLQSNASHIHLTPDEGSWLVSCIPIGGVIGVISLAYSTTYIGRKTILSAVAVPHFISWILTIFGSTIWVLYVARTLVGMGITISFIISPLYLAEISEDDIRGILVTLNQVAFNTGVLIEYSLGPYVSFTCLASISAAFSGVFFLVIIWIPESPYFLLSRGLTDKAQISLMKLRGANESSVVQQELKLMQTAVDDAQRTERAPLKSLFMKRGNRRALIIVLSMLTLQQLIGHFAVMSYTLHIFQSSAANVLNPNISVIVLGVILLLSSIILSSQVDRVGRRPLLIVSGCGATLCVLIVGIYFYISDKTNIDVSAVAWIPLVSFIIFLSFHSLALGVIPYTIMGEVFSVNVKNLAAAISTVFSSSCALIVTKLFQILADGFGIYCPFIMFSILGALGTIFAVWYVPETKGKSFIQIQNELQAPEYPKRRNKQDPS